MKLKILGVVTLYHPDLSAAQNIVSYAAQVDQLIVWDNTPREAQNNESIAPALLDNVIYKSTGSNIGLGEPFNTALAYAIAHGYTHLLTMDQDSAFNPGDFETYCNLISTNQSNKVGAFACNVNMTFEDMQSDWLPITSCITSGTIYPVAALQAIGGFNAAFFIDAIDTEVCLKLRRAGYSIVCAPQIKLAHKFGEPSLFYAFGRQFKSANYPPIRTYYILRNHTILKLKYPEYRKEKGFYHYFLFKQLFHAVAFKKHKYIELKACIMGMIHGILKVKGSCTII